MTSEPKWTPGPWFANGAAVVVDTREQVCCGRRQDECCGEPDVKGGCEIIAECGELDARLIAAAPELYEALERLTKAADRLMQNIHEFDKPTDQEFGDAVDSAIFSGTMALKKARGE